ncbi:hypothetical protein G6734_02725 [Polynucleobacter paneuropaeus]|nr:hypothetical protein [Polynucleobacter paneuropaeus]
MSDRYGTMVLTYSNNLECNFDGLIGSLNQFKWSNENLIWNKDCCKEKTYIYAAEESGWNGLIEHPSIFPQLEEAVMKNEDGTYDVIPNPTPGELEEAWMTRAKEVPLENLTKLISQNLHNGYIEIVCVGHNHQKFVYMGRLKIHSDGTSSRSHVTCGLDYDYEYSDEYKG